MFKRLRLEFGVAPLESGEASRSGTERVTQSGRRYRPGTTHRVRKPTYTKQRPIQGPRPNFTKAQPVEPAKVIPWDGEILIAVMGVTGSGKSYFCRSATGNDDIEVGDGLESCNAADTATKYIFAD
jgi:hypothetical protein